MRYVGFRLFLPLEELDLSNMPSPSFLESKTQGTLAFDVCQVVCYVTAYRRKKRVNPRQWSNEEDIFLGSSFRSSVPG